MANKDNNLKPGPSKFPAGLDKKFEQLNMHEMSSSDESADSQGRYSAETTHSGRYYVRRPDQFLLYPPGHQPQPPFYAGGHPSAQFNIPHSYVGVGKVREDMLYVSGVSYCPASRVENPFNLDLSKLPRPPCYCGTCSQVQQPNISPSQSQAHWSGQADCAAETFSSVDYKGPPSYNHQFNGFYPSKVSTNGDMSPNIYSSVRQNQNPKFPMRDSTEFREMTYDSSISSVHQSQPNAFCFQQSYPRNISDVESSEEYLSSQLPLSMNPVKESLLEGLKDGQSYTQIFPDKRRTPTEGSSGDY